MSSKTFNIVSRIPPKITNPTPNTLLKFPPDKLEEPESES
jgi:hypothetical protein